jgi:hypothetical protein
VIYNEFKIKSIISEENVEVFLFLFPIVPAISGVANHNKPAIFTDSQPIGNPQIVDENGGLFCGRIILHKSACVISFKTCNEKLPVKKISTPKSVSVSEMKKKDSTAGVDPITHLVSSIVQILQQQIPSTVPQFQCKKILQQRILSAYTQFRHKRFPYQHVLLNFSVTFLKKFATEVSSCSRDL